MKLIHIFPLVHRSSDSAKYTNKSSGASITSMTHSNKPSGHLSSLKQHHHHSVSSKRPPMCPNRHNNIMHKTTSIPAVHNSTSGSGGNPTTCTSSILSPTASTTISQSTANATAAATATATTNHANPKPYTTNNCLHNNSSFYNNHYTFSLNRLSRHGGGSTSFNSNSYLDSLPYHYQLTSSSAASCYNYGGGGGGGAKYYHHASSRGTKSDIGVPVTATTSHGRRGSGKKFTTSRTTPNIQEHSSTSNDRINKDDMNGNRNRTNSPIYNAPIYSATGVDYLENYKATSMDLFNKNKGNNNETGTTKELTFDRTNRKRSFGQETVNNYAVPIDVSK